MATSNNKTVTDDHRGIALAGYAIIVLTFGVLGGWAAVAPLASAVVAPGVVTAEMSRKTLQHYEGGIVSQILVREGDHVEKAQVLFRLDQTQPRASVEIMRNQLYANVAREARLSAELSQAKQITWPIELLAEKDEPVVKRAMDDQLSQFSERRASIEGQFGILRTRQNQLRREIDGLNHQKLSAEQQLAFIDAELVGLRSLLDKQLVQRTRVLAMERERSRLSGEIGRFVAEIAKSEKAVGESELQAQQIQQKFQEEAGHDIGETREKLADARTKVAVAQDVLRRLDVPASDSGTVQNLKVFTIGAVIRPGEPLLDIVPTNDQLVVQAHVSPLDIESLEAGKAAELRFLAFHEKTMPMIRGTVVSVSRDRLIDESTRQPYFLAIVTVTDHDLPERYRDKLTSGMNAEVVVPTRQRTALDYIVEPFLARVHMTSREQ